MPDPITGTIMAVGTIASTNEARKSRKSQESSAAETNRIAQEQLDFEKQQYAEQQQRWNDTYGSVEQNLSDYYNTLDADYYEVRGLESFQLEQEQTLAQLRETLAQRGLDTSGAAAAAEIAAASQQASTRAQIRSEAEDAVMQQKQSFLSIGMGNQPTTAGISNAYNAVQNVANQQYAAASQMAAQTQAQANQALSNVGYAIASNYQPTGLSSSSSQDYFNVQNGL